MLLGVAATALGFEGERVGTDDEMELGGELSMGSEEAAVELGSEEAAVKVGSEEAGEEAETCDVEVVEAGVVKASKWSVTSAGPQAR